MTKTAFVLGNGKSRSPLNLETLKLHGTIYGCNALYRTFSPDYLIAVDSKMIHEINSAGYQHQNSVWTNSTRRIKNYQNFNYFEPSKGWSSGPTALWFASEHGYEEIFILGFDYKGLNNGKTVNNIYADTKNYKKSNDTATFYGNWLRQTVSTICNFPKIKFRRVVNNDSFIPDQMVNIDNLEHVKIEDFQEKFKDL